MLILEDYPAAFASPNFSAELHGDEPKPVMSIYVEAVVHAANLESFKAGLLNALWYRPAINDSSRLDDSGNVHELVRRFPTIKSVHFEDKLGRGYTLTIKGDLVDEAQTWADMEVGKVSIEPQDGGTARLRFRLQARGEGLESWVGMMNQGRSITLTPPKDEPMPAGHPDANDDDSDGLAGSLEFGRDAQDSDDANDDAGAPEGLDAARLAEADRDATESPGRKAAGKRGKRSNGAATLTH